MPPRIALAPFQGMGLVVPKTTLGADSASWTITIPASIYNHLKIVFNGRTDNAAANSRLLVRPNNNSTLNNLLGQTIQYNGGAPTFEQWRVNEISPFIGGNIAGMTNYNSGCFVDIFGYLSTTKYKAVHVHSDYVFSLAGATGGYSFGGGMYLDTAAITSVVFAGSGGDKILAGATVVVYGE